MCSRPLASERSVFGTGCRWVCASSAVAVRRGSITTCRAPRSRPSSRKRIAGGIVSAGLLPTRTSTSAFGMSSNGNGRPRSIPNARVAGRDRGRHAEPAVVVDVAAAQRDADELAELVGLLVGQPAPAERADGVPAVRGLRAGDRRRDPVERVVPARGAEGGIAGVPDERGGQPFRVVEQLGGGGALDAQPTAVDGEVRPADQLERAVRPGRERDPALQGAVRAVRGDACGHHTTPVTPAGGVRDNRTAS